MPLARIDHIAIRLNRQRPIQSMSRGRCGVGNSEVRDGTGSGERRPDETCSAKDQADGREDERPRGGANPRAHLLIQSSAMLDEPEVEDVDSSPRNVMSSHSCEDSLQARNVLRGGLGYKVGV